MAGNDVEIRVRVNDQTQMAFRDINGRLRDSRGRFVSESAIMGGAAGALSANLRGLGSAIGSMFSTIMKGMAGLAAAGGGVNVIAGLAAAAAESAGALLLLPAAAAAAGLAVGTLKIGMSGFGDALAATGEDAAAFEAAIADLAPAAQETARAFRDLRPAWDGLKLDVQQQLFEGMAGPVRELGARYLPMLRGAMVDVAASFNTAARDVADFFNNAELAGDVGEGMDFLSTAVQNVVGELSGFAEGFYLIGRVGAEVLADLTGGMSGVGERFADFIGELRRSGQLEEIMRGGLEALSQLGAVLGNVGQILFEVFSQLSTSGAGLFAVLEQVTGQILAFVQSAQGMQLLGAIGETLRVAGEMISTVLGAALQALAPMLVAIAPLIQTLATSLGTLLVGAINTLAPVLLQVVTVLAAQLQPILPQLAASLLSVVEAIVPLLPQLAELVVAVLPLIPPLVELAAAVIPAFVLVLRAAMPIIQLVAQILVAVLVPALQALTSQVNMTVANWQASFAAAGQALNQWAAVVRAAITQVLGIVRNLPGQIRALMSGAGSWLIASGRAMIDGFAAGIRSAFGAVIASVRAGIASVRALFPFSPAKEGPFSGSGYVTHSGKALTEDFAASLRAGMPTVESAAAGVLGSARTGLTGGASVGAGGGGMPAPVAARSSGGGSAGVHFSGNVDSAFATAFMKLVRSGQIQIQN